MYSVFGRLILVVIVTFGLASAGFCGDWPQHQHDPARSGFTPEELAPPYEIAWQYNFLPERPARRTQAIIYQQKVYVGTQQGTMYCFAATDGEVLWKYPDAGSIQHSAACANGKVVFTSLDGCVYALDADGGTVAWKTQTNGPFTVAPLIADGIVYAGNHRGTFLAIDIADGGVLWETDIDAPILNSAACADGRVYFGSEDMYMHALDAQTGQKLWQSPRLRGMSFKDFHPVCHRGRVLVRPMTSFEADIYAGYSPYGSWPNDLPGGWWAVWTSAPEPLPNFKTRYQAATMERTGRMPAMLLRAQEPVIEHFKNHPADQDFFILDSATGAQTQIPPHFRVNSIHGPVTPPVEDINGTVIVPWVHINNGWGRYDIEKNRMVELMIPPKPTNADNTVNASCGGRYVFLFHATEGNAQYTGVYDLKTKTWHHVRAANVPWYDTNECGNPVSIAAGKFFHIYFYTIIARAPKQPQ